MKDKEVTRVIFRTFENGEVIALFPELDEGSGLCASYVHVGQHGAANYSYVIRKTIPATPRKYRELLAELKSIGYNLRVYRRS